MRTRDYSFNLPEAQIAQYPPEHRGTSRLMVLNRRDGSRAHDSITHLAEYLEPGTVLVLNDTRVRKARLYGLSDTGSRVEFLLIRRIGDASWKAVVSRSKKQRPGRGYTFPGGLKGTIGGGEEGIREIIFDRSVEEDYFEAHGHVPLPPYIRRPDTETDSERYQTVYSRTPGSSAAPTAGLHFTRELLEGLADRGLEIHYITLHVGLGTFLPIRTERVEDHRMHEESYEISARTASALAAARKEGRRICAVGTTSVRTLESAWQEGGPKPGRGSTSIYIYPGYRFRGVDCMLTNFHTPESSLLLLVSAFAGWERIKEAYEEAVQRGYRFFSYGDAMLIL